MNVLLIMVDEMDGRKMGCAGWEGMHTPNLDALAARGTLCNSAYCTSPLCVPSRASFVTGRHVHQLHCWDNASPFDESWETFGHRLESQGVPVTAFGKLDFVEPCGDHGFERVEFDRHREFGDMCAHFRNPMCRRVGARERLDKAGPKDISGCQDEQVFERSLEFLRSDEAQDGPWMLWSSYTNPHFAHYAPPELYDLYDPEEIDFPPLGDLTRLNQLNRDLRYHFEVEEIVDDDTWMRNIRGYHGLISYIDRFVGGLVEALEEEGLAEDTLIIFTSDHGEMLGAHGMWWKCAPFEPSVRVPLIIAGPDIAPGEVIDDPVSLIDLFPTIVEAAGCELTEADADLRGRSLLPVARGDKDAEVEGVVLSQYHGHGVRNGWFLVRKGDLKLIHYHGYGHEMYDVVQDPDELRDLARDPDAHRDLATLDGLVHEMVDPEVADTTAKADQAIRLEYFAEHMDEEQFEAHKGKCEFDPDEE